MIEASEDLTKGTFSDALLDFKSVGNLVMDFADVLSFVVVEATVFESIRRGSSLATLPLLHVDEVYLVVFEDLCLFNLQKIF